MRAGGHQITDIIHLTEEGEALFGTPLALCDLGEATLCRTCDQFICGCLDTAWLRLSNPKDDASRRPTDRLGSNSLTPVSQLHDQTTTPGEAHDHD